MRVVLFVTVLLLTFRLEAQEFKKPSLGKSMVYFVRYSGTGLFINFKYFDEDMYLGKFNGMNYMTYECEPGKHVFWASGDNRQFVEADLLSDKVYVVEVIPTIGTMKAGLKLFPLQKENKESLANVAELLNKKEPRLILNSESEYDMEEKLTNSIRKGLEEYNRRKNGGEVFFKLKPEMYHN